jgi:hypothetical protein
MPTDALTAPTPLTDHDAAVLRAWTPAFLETPDHQLARFQFARGLAGEEHTAIVGPLGVGKSYTVEYLTREIDEAEAAQARESEGAHVPRRVFTFTTSTAAGRKTLLLDLYEAITGETLSAGNRRAWTPRHLIECVVTETLAERYHLLVVDEAQMADETNLDQLRQVGDVAAKRGHPLGIVVVGTEELREKLVRIRQLGQRFSCEIRMPRITREEIGPHVIGFHPHLPALAEQLGAARWDALLAELFAKVNGSFRRLAVVLTNANAITRGRGEWMTEDVLRVAIEKLAPEV